MTRTLTVMLISAWLVTSAQASEVQAVQAWVGCLRAGVEALADQPESAEVIVRGVMGACQGEELAYDRTLEDDRMIEDMRVWTAERVLGEVLAHRAALAKIKGHGAHLIYRGS